MKKLYTTLAACGLATFASAQLVVDTTFNDPNGISTFLTGAGITLSNMTINCHNQGISMFDASNTNLTIGSGMIMSTGSVLDAIGPNTNGSTTTAAQGAGDSDLDALSGSQTFDACAIEFDAVPAFNLLLFDYIFASEEYLEFVNAGFHDVFAIYVSGPGFNGLENVAWVPGTTNAVNIDNINMTVNSAYYMDNGDGNTAPYNTDPTYVGFDGLTTVLPGIIPVQAGQTYHFKIVVADVGDMAFDSAVMLRANSFSSTPASGLEDYAATLPVLFPNPATDHVNIDLNLVSGTPVSVMLIDALGRELQARQVTGQTRETLSLEGLSEGAYFVVINTTSGREVQPLVVR